MTLVCALFTVFHTAFPFANSFDIICATSAFMEFFMGMMDTDTI